ncbi:OmpA family protein [Hyalangium rubrum]|uniref:OmpA family protein n=1 Tax=Hyalangium rubrum TaxID=3103134 RepID=A0ABU5GZB8_9BACT|nr:OmpA family protein [Hyalangium sp. s54d21]MDY7226224.1 OmpA family protein [Hyalangium sp. s54d21]
MHRWKQRMWGLGAAAALLAGCAAHGPPPRELLDARAAYQRVSTSTAVRTESSNEVTEAWHALLEAEREYDRNKDSARTRSLAYIALRKAQLAEARASIAVAERQRALAAQALRETQEAQRQRALGELEAAQQQLAEARRMRDEAARLAQARQLQAEAARLQAEARRQQEETERLAAEERQRQEAQQRLAQAETQLEAERRAREEAEARASEALTELARAGEVQVQEDARGTVLTLSGSVLFASGAAELLPSARNRLSEVADALKQSDNQLTIEGHTDAQGPDGFNEELSLRRAERVRDYLVSQGVSSDRVSVRGLGEYRPVASNSTAEGRANNRRVEIVLQRAPGDDAPTGIGGSGKVRER